MGIKLGKSGKLPGENLIQGGMLLCFLSVLLYLVIALNGAGNGLVIFGGGVLGLLIICVGYLKRISAAVMASTDITEAASEH